MLALKYEKFDKVGGTGSGHSLATISQGSLQSLGPSFSLPCRLLSKWHRCWNGLFILIRPQSGAWGRMWNRNSD